MRNILLALTLLAAPMTAAAARPLAIVINSGEASVSLIDMDTHAELRRVPMLREPHHMALTPDGASLMIGDTAGNALIFLDPATGDVQRRMTVSDPYQLQYSPDAKWLTVAGLARNQIDIYDAATMQLAHRIPASSMPSHMNYSPDSATVYVSLQGTDELVAIDVRKGTVLWKTKVGSSPAGVLWLNGRILVGIMGADNVAIVDPANGAVERRVQTGKGAHNLFVSPDQRTLYVCNRVDGSISMLDPKTLAVRGRIVMPGGPDDMDFAPDGKIWVTRRWAHSVALLDPATGQFTTIETGRSPHGIWLNTHPVTPVKVSAK
jgi:DNA-binding beta-propeller fold protein YncE